MKWGLMTEHARLSGILSREGIEHSVPLKFRDDVVGRIVIKPDGKLELDLNMSRAGCTLRDILVEGDLNALGVYFMAAKEAVASSEILRRVFTEVEKDPNAT